MVVVAAAAAVIEAGAINMKPRQLILSCLAASAIALWLPTAAQAQAAFKTPEAAASALIDAASINQGSAWTKVLGKDWRKLLPKDKVDPQDRIAFLDKARQAHAVKVDGKKAELTVGSDDPWTFPVPLVQGKDGQWRFDPKAGREAMRTRRIGTNERSAIQASLAYADAQREYASADRNGDGVLEYARRLVSQKGQRDGLVWSPELGDDSPLGEAYLPAKAADGYHGYRFRILEEQGPNAAGGAHSYLIGKRMLSGYALLAWPVAYGETGVMSFIVNQDGTVYQRDLGPDTPKAVKGIKSFDPSKDWQPTKP